MGKVTPEYNLAVLHPEVAKQWHPTKNGELVPENVAPGSSKKRWWECDKGPDHEWQTSVSNRTGHGTGCPCCSGQKISVTNSLSVLHPHIASEWHPTKNGVLSLSDITPSSSKRVWWKCGEGPDHEWQTTVNNRTQEGRGRCPYCIGLFPSVTNCLSTKYPEIAKEWHPTKNGDLSPTKVLPGSDKKRWWICDKGPDHEWKAGVGNRTKNGTRCPFCAGQKVSVTNSLEKLFPRIAAEWHPTKNGDLKPGDFVFGSAKSVWWKCSNGHEWKTHIFSRAKDGMGCRKCSYSKRKKIIPRKLYEGKKVSDIPWLFLEWHPTKNSSHEPSKVTYGSAKKIWWFCSDGHEWVQTPNARTSMGLDCPYCGGSVATKETSFAGIFPELAAEWHPTKNGELTPQEVLPASNKKAWWICDKGPDHQWEMQINSRANGQNCPFCAGKRVSVTNSLATLARHLTGEWHPTKNGDLTPEKITGASAKKVWWKCGKGPDHEWTAQVKKRTLLNRGCPSCAGRQISVTNSVSAVKPALIKEWDYTKNDFGPEDVVAGSHKKIWWKCDEGPDHEWQTTAVYRTSRERNCPFCAGWKLSVTNRLDLNAEKIASEWHPTKNGKLKPSEVTTGNQRQIWWQCVIGHEWQTSIHHRVGSKGYEGTDCPECHILPRSKTEVSLTFELQQFFDFDMDKHKLKIAGKILDADIILDKHKLVIEYDGSYWHKDKQKTDASKTEKLREAGWEVIRIRESPLEPVTPKDIIVQSNPKTKVLANATLQQIEKVCDISIPGLDDYLKRERPINKQAADKYIAKLQRDEQQSTLEV